MMDENKTESEEAVAEDISKLIDYEIFSKIELKVGKILSAEPVPKSNKLLKMEVNLGEQIGIKQILGGIAKHYSPEELIGKQVIVVANLKPAKLMGLESQGMLLAASTDQGVLELINVSEVINPGSTVR